MRATILSAALSVLAADGIEGFTTRRVAQGAGTSTPALYELFGDRAGLVREMFYEGFRLLRARFDALPVSSDPAADVGAVIAVFREFARTNPGLSQLMFTRAFADFDPGPDDLEAGHTTHEHVIRLVQRCIDARVLDGEATDIAHVMLATCQGLAVQETAGWLGTSERSRDRRWALAVEVLLAGLAPGGRESDRGRR